MSTGIQTRDTGLTYTPLSKRTYTHGGAGIDRRDTYDIELNIFGPRVFTSGSVESRAREIVSQIDTIQSQLKLGISGIASLLGVSRQAVYKWLSGESSPETTRYSRLLDLLSLSDKCARAGLKKSERVLDVSQDEEGTLRQHFKAGSVTDSLLEKAAKAVMQRELAYAQSGIAESRSPVRDDWRH